MVRIDRNEHLKKFRLMSHRQINAYNRREIKEHRKEIRSFMIELAEAEERPLSTDLYAKDYAVD